MKYTKYLRSFGFPALAAMLALLLMLEWLLPATSGSAKAGQHVMPAPSLAGTLDDDAQQWADVSLARPLFQPDRRPVSTSANTDTSLPRLSAIILMGGTRIAIFSMDGQKPQVLTAGGTINGYRLTRILTDSVELLGPEGTLTLRLQFKSTAPATPGASNPPFGDEPN